MKKLIYNEYTKEINIIEYENTKEAEKKIKIIRKIKESLERNKIFFEIFSYVFVGIMGIVIAFVGWKTNERSADIYLKQLEILDNDREPYFTIDCNSIIERFESKDDYYIKNMYTIKNEGGLIKGAFLYGARGYATIFLMEPETKTERIFKLHISGMFKNSDGLTSLYDEENRNFYFYGYEGSKYDDFRTELEAELDELFEEYIVNVLFENYVDIVYVNYKNEECRHTYKFSEERLILSTMDTEKERIYVGSVEGSENAESVAKDIYNIIKEKEIE